ncbi:DUF4221 domain-containing protein [Algoriphagus marincola]|uniref:DUF4221 domain-containing protein n=1 Tax=Algoriphagus marincola TaxID=264027 RepID=A0ABS7N5S6_9BACT|nr:DUF4221 family protein [Algoriphagus marincola]MBY5951691.1 DUF4221 domain-containing protein [Algoriphagus marincola]
MKIIFRGLTLLLFFSCTEKASEQIGEGAIQTQTYTKNQLDNLQITLDTLKVDVGEELVISSAYYGFGLSEDGKSIFFSESQSSEIHEIDLAELKLLRRIPFEKDGPNRAPDFVESFDVLPNNEFLLANYAVQAIFNEEAEKIFDLKLQAEEYDGIDESLGGLYSSLAVSPDKKKAFSLPAPFGEFTAGLAFLDLESKTGELLDLPALDLTQNFQVTFSQNGGMTTSGDMIRMEKIKDQLVIYSGSTADIYLYDMQSDSLMLLKFDHQLVENQKKGTFKTQAASQEERREISAQIQRQISFYGFIWDESRQQYFRFGVMKNGLRETGEPLPDDVYLFSYDPDFNLLGEKKIEELSNVFFNGFFFDGKIYNYRPVDEDPGFVVMTLEF